MNGRNDTPGAAGSIIPAAWSFMLAARERGLGTCWTTLHLMHEEEAADVLGIPLMTFNNGHSVRLRTRWVLISNPLRDPMWKLLLAGIVGPGEIVRSER